jgi:hypothetical protein
MKPRKLTVTTSLKVKTASNAINADSQKQHSAPLLLADYSVR